MNAADFSVNDYVVYKGVGVCRIEAVENKTFDGEKYEDYLKLVPLGSGFRAGGSGGKTAPQTHDRGRGERSYRQFRKRRDKPYPEYKRT